MKVLLMTTRDGGPKIWADSFKEYSKKSTGIDIEVVSSTSQILKKHFQFNKYDIIHTTVPILWNLSNTPLIINFRGDFKREISFRHPFNILYFWSKLWTKQYISPSKFLAKKLKIKAKIIPNAKNSDSYKIKKSYAITSLKLVTLSRFDLYEKAKGIISLSKALDKLDIPYTCDVYGGGAFLEKIKKQCPNLRFHGFDKKATQKIASYDVFVYYSHLDNFPNAILDAMACAMPIVTNNVGAVSEMINNDVNGFIVNTPSQFKKAVEKIVSNKDLRKKFGVAARRKLEKEFSWAAVYNKLINYYKGVS